MVDYRTQEQIARIDFKNSLRFYRVNKSRSLSRAESVAPDGSQAAQWRSGGPHCPKCRTRQLIDASLRNQRQAFRPFQAACRVQKLLRRKPEQAS